MPLTDAQRARADRWVSLAFRGAGKWLRTRGGDREELLSLAMWGLVLAAMRFDASRHSYGEGGFEKYAIRMIFYSMKGRTRTFEGLAEDSEGNTVVEDVMTPPPSHRAEVAEEAEVCRKLAGGLAWVLDGVAEGKTYNGIIPGRVDMVRGAIHRIRNKVKQHRLKAWGHHE